MNMNNGISLRRLLEKDASLMLEWIKDPDVNKHFRFNHENMNMESAKKFIRKSRIKVKNANFAIVDHNDEYLGTVSLKNIDLAAKNAEYAIALRKKAQGKGLGYLATIKILEYAFIKRGLERVYLNVFSDNETAIAFYKKFGFSFEGEFIDHICVHEKKRSIKWFRMLKSEFLNRKEMNTIHDVKMLEFPELGDDKGHLVVIEGGVSIPFEIKRIFYIYGSDSGIVRGQHANRRSAFCLINISGRSKVKVIDRNGEEVIFELNRPHIGIYLPSMIWKDMYEFSSDSVLLVLSNEHYDGSEYIRNLNDYLEGTAK